MKRIHELAKEQAVDPQSIVDLLKNAGLPASKCTPSSTISEDWERRLAPHFARLRDMEKRKQDKERISAATAAHQHAAHTKGKSTTPPSSETGRHVKGTAAAPGDKPARASGRLPAAGKKGKPKLWKEEASETTAPAAAPELDAWVDASAPKEKKPSKREQRELQKKSASERMPAIDGEEISALDDLPPVAPSSSRPLTEEEIIRANGAVLTPPTESERHERHDRHETHAEPAPVAPAPVAPPRAPKHHSSLPELRAPEREVRPAPEPRREPRHEPKAEPAAPPPAPAPVAQAPAPAPVPAAPEPRVPRAPKHHGVRDLPPPEARKPEPAPEPVKAAPAAPAPVVAPAPPAPEAPKPKTEAELRAERRAEKARLERERDEWLKQEKERVDRERADKARIEAAKNEAVRAEREKLDAAKAERERVENAKAERERLRKEAHAREKEISPAAAALAAAMEAKKRREAGGSAMPVGEDGEDAEDGALIGDVLLGEIPMDDEEIGTSLGMVPEGPTKKGPIPIVRKDKGPSRVVATGPRGDVKTGFQAGKGFSVQGGGRGGFEAPRGVGNSRGGAPTAPSQTGPGGRRQFFPIRGGSGGHMPGRGSQQPVRQEKPTKVSLTPPFTVKELSEKMGVKVPDIIRTMMRKGKMITLNAALTEELALEIGIEFNCEIDVQKKIEAEDELAALSKAEEGKPEDRKARPPIITILGHVDHGKTSLLDKIRKTNVAAGEAGGITQHIGAYKVGHGNKAVVFVDTPGHEAFTEMRARGANVTDVAVLVVAADDGIMPQTEEAYNHAKAAGVPVVVALNKIDKPGANAMRVKQQLATMGLQPVEWGGTTEVIEVSALTGKGIDDLLETLALQSEILELRANPDRPATGTCLEARVSEGRGIVAHLLVLDGTLKRGDMVVCGAGFGKVRALFDDMGHQMKEAPPGTPVEVIGLEEVPEPGARFYVLDDVQKAKEIAADRALAKRQSALADRQSAHVTLDNLFAKLKEGSSKEIRIVLKTDVKGSMDVLSKEIPAKSNDEIKVRILHAAVGGITEADVQLADASDAIIVGFNVVADEKAKARAEQKGVDMRTYRIIYQIADDIRKAMEGMLAPEEREAAQAKIEIRRIFTASQIGTIAGCMVKSGTVNRAHRVRLIRDNVVKFDGEIAGLRRLKDDVKEVREGMECGITLKGYNDIMEGDRMETYSIEKIARTLG